MDTASFSAVMHSLRGEPGLTVTQCSPMLPEYRIAMGPFPARLRLGFDIDPEAGIVPEVVLGIAVAEVCDRWAIVAAWGAAQDAAKAEHNLPSRLPAPDITFPEGNRRAVEIAYRARLDDFDVATALTLLHIGAAFAAFMARELAPDMSREEAGVLASYGIEPGSAVPFPAEILARDCGRAAIASVA